MSEDLRYRFIVCAAYVDDSSEISHVVVALSEGLQTALVKLQAAWSAAAAAYGSRAPSVTVWSNDAYFVSALPEHWDVPSDYGWHLITRSPLEQLAVEETESDAEVLLFLDNHSVRMASENMQAEDTSAICFRGREKYSDCSASTPDLPDFVLEWAAETEN
jgi:hypothetical protein